MKKQIVKGSNMMKPWSNFKANAMLRRFISTLSIALLASTLAVYSAEDITDVHNSEDAGKLAKHIAKNSDIQELIKFAGNSDKFHAQYNSIVRLGELKDAAGAPVLWSVVEDPKIREGIRVLATKSLGQISSPEYFEPLLKVAQKAEPEVYPLVLRQEAAIALCHYNNPKGPELLIKNIKDNNFTGEELLYAFEILKAEDAEKIKDALIKNVRSGAVNRFSAIYLLACQPKPDDKSIDTLIHAAIHEKNEYVRELVFCIMTGQREHFESFMNVPMNFIGIRDAKDKLIAAIPEFEKSVDPDQSFIFAEVCRLFTLLDHPDALAALIRMANSNHEDSSLAVKSIYMNTHADARKFFADRIKNEKVSAKDRISYLNALNLETYNGKLVTELPKEIADAIMEVVKNENDEDAEVRKQAILTASKAFLPVVDYAVAAIKTTKDPDYKKQLIASLQFQQNDTSLAFLKELIGKEKDAKDRWLAIHTAYYLSSYRSNWLDKDMDKEMAAIFETVGNDESQWLRTEFLDTLGNWTRGSAALQPHFAWLKKEPDAELRWELVRKLIYTRYSSRSDYTFITNELLHTLENDDDANVRETAAYILNGIVINSYHRFTLPDPKPSIVRVNAIIDKTTDEKMKATLVEVRDQWKNPKPAKKR